MQAQPQVLGADSSRMWHSHTHSNSQTRSHTHQSIGSQKQYYQTPTSATTHVSACYITFYVCSDSGFHTGFFLLGGGGV